MDRKTIIEVGVFGLVAAVLVYALQQHNKIVNVPTEPVVPARYPDSQAPNYLQYNLPPYRNSLVNGVDLYFKPPNNSNGTNGVGRPSSSDPSLPLPTCGCSSGNTGGIDLGNYASSINAMLQNFSGALGDVMENYVDNILGSMPDYWRQYLNNPGGYITAQQSQDMLSSF